VASRPDFLTGRCSVAIPNRGWRKTDCPKHVGPARRTSASHQILAGSATHTIDTPGWFACLFSMAHAYGHNCSCQLMRGSYCVGLASTVGTRVTDFN
jgi:hypothetical protein